MAKNVRLPSWRHNITSGNQISWSQRCPRYSRWLVR